MRKVFQAEKRNKGGFAAELLGGLAISLLLFLILMLQLFDSVAGEMGASMYMCPIYDSDLKNDLIHAT